MKSDIFNFGRFARYFGTDLKSAFSNYGISLLVLSTMPLTVNIVNGLCTWMTLGHWSGTNHFFRGFLFALYFLITIVNAPSKLYGKLTEKKYGTAYLMLPASTLEKLLSMLVITVFIIPAVFLTIYLSVDLLVAWIDPTVNDSLINLIDKFDDTVKESAMTGNISFTAFMKDPSSIFRPLLFIDDYLFWPLAFLLGAIFFRKSKVAATFGCIIAVSMVISSIISPFLFLGSDINGNVLLHLDNFPPSEIERMFPSLYWYFNHLALIDTISDQICVLGLLTGLWFRLKRIKQ